MHSEDKKWENGKSTSDLYKRKKGSEGIEDKNFHDRRTKLKAKASGRISSERKKKKRSSALSNAGKISSETLLNINPLDTPDREGSENEDASSSSGDHR